MSDAPSTLRWLTIVRLGLVQAALGAVVVLITSTLNRVMIVEYSLPAVLPALLVALQYGVQMVRPRFGFGSDVGGRRTPWIIGGMSVLAAGGVLCALATVWMHTRPLWGLLLAVIAYAVVGLGVGAAGTSLLVLLAKQADDRRRAAAATIMWILMIAGFAITSSAVGHFLDPFSAPRLVLVTTVAACIAWSIALLAVWGVEKRMEASAAEERARPLHTPFREALRQVWAEPQSRGFTLFVFISMLAYSAQELILEPFAGLVFHYSLGDSARLSGLQHASVFCGMISIGVACSGARPRFGSLRSWTIGGCVASALALFSLLAASLAGPGWPLRASVSALGFANGAFAVAAIGSMMALAHVGRPGLAGVRMGLWGAAQAVAFAFGGLFGGVIVDGVRWLSGSPVAAFAIVFGFEALLFLAAAQFARRVDSLQRRGSSAPVSAVTV
jgi:MFS transporter, BCD family, chlorophyll transporter